MDGDGDTADEPTLDQRALRDLDTNTIKGDALRCVAFFAAAYPSKGYLGFLRRIPAANMARAASNHSIRQIWTACQSSTVVAV